MSRVNKRDKDNEGAEEKRKGTQETLQVTKEIKHFFFLSQVKRQRRRNKWRAGRCMKIE